MRRILLLCAALAASYGCTGGLSCGSSSGCGNNYPDFPLDTATVPNGDNFVDNGVRMRMTQNALDFITANIRPLLEAAFTSDPNNPGILVINDAAEHDLGNNISINSSLNHSGHETRPLSIFIDGNAIADTIQLDFVGVSSAPDGIHFAVSNIPVGIDARVFADASFFGGTFSGSAACDLSGSNASLGGFPWFTTVSIDATITPRVGHNGECTGGAPDCLKIDVVVNSAQIGGFGSGDLSVDSPPVCPNAGCDFGVSCHDGTPDGDGPCSEDCSDTNAVIDTSGDAECVATCAVGGFVVDVATGLGGVVEPILNDFLPQLLEGAISNALSSFDGSPLAASGRLNLASFAPGVMPDDTLDLGFALGPTTGAFDVNAPDPTPGAQGMDLIMKTGFEAAPSLTDADEPVPNPCVRTIAGNDFAQLYGNFDFEAPDAQPLTGVFNGQVYALGASLAAAGLNQAAFAAYNSGALCIEMSSDSIFKLTKGGFAIGAGAVDTLAGGKLRQFTSDDAPVIIALAPSQPPIITYGEGTDSDGHIHIDWPGVDINFYVLMNERFARVFDVSADISLQLTVFNDPGSGTLKIAVVDGPNVGNFNQKYDELLPGVAFGDVLNTLVSTALDGVLGNGLSFNFDVGPLLSNALGGAPIFVQFVGIETTPASDRQFLNVYLGLTNQQQQPQVARTHQLHLADDPGVFKQPEVENTTLRALPTGEVHVETDDALENREYFARVDFGLWRGPIRPSTDGQIVVRDAKLKLVGEHTITVRARTIGDPNSLEPEDEAQTVSVWVDADAPKVSLELVGHDVVAHGHDIGTTEEQLVWQWQLDDGAWSDSSSTSVRSVKELGERGAHRVAVRAIDRAGNVSKAAGLDLEIAKRRVDDDVRAHPSSFGCAQVGVDGVWLAALALGAVGLVRRRRR